MNRMSETFLDAAFAIALSSPGDHFHSRAIELAERLERDETTIVTTRAVLLEIGNALSKQRYRADCILLLQSLENDPKIEIASLTDELFARAFQLYCDRPDKEWGLIDCVSFTVMQDRGIIGALTTDVHFRQAGFEVLMREGL